MKFGIFVLLGLCAFAHASNNFHLEIQERNLVTDKLHQMVDDFVKDANNEFNKIASKVGGVADSLRNNINSIISSSNTEINNLSGDVTSKLSEMLAKGGTLKTCAEQIVPQLSDLKSVASSAFKTCGKGLLESAITYEQQVSSHIIALSESLLEVYDIVEECSNFTILNAISCATDLITKTKTLVTSIITQATAAVEISRSNAISTADSVRACNAAPIRTATTDIQTIRTKTQQCS